MPTFEVTMTQVVAFKNFRFSGSYFFEMGSGLLPFSITPAGGNSAAARAILTADQGRVDTFDLGADPESGAIFLGDGNKLHNVNGYLPAAGLGHKFVVLVAYFALYRVGN
jgi:hypothetical protein